MASLADFADFSISLHFSKTSQTFQFAQPVHKRKILCSLSKIEKKTSLFKDLEPDYDYEAFFIGANVQTRRRENRRNMITRQINRSILCDYPDEYRAVEVRPLVPAFSLGECRYWRVETAENILCLRRWPRGKPPIEQLQFSQAVLWHAVCEGIDFVPLPFETVTHHGFVIFEGSFWELMPWFEGRKDFLFRPSRFPRIESLGCERRLETPEVNSNVSKNRMFYIVSALMALAQYHLAVSSFPLPHFPFSSSPGVRSFLAGWKFGVSGSFTRTKEILSDAWENPEKSVFSGHRALLESGRIFLDHALSYAGTALPLLDRTSRLSVPIQPTIGNLCDRHLCFDEEGLCGILDFTRIGVDSVSLDVASLLASLADADSTLWTLGLKAYQSIRPLSDRELLLVEAFDRPRIFLEGLDWLEKVFLRDEAFSQRQIDEIARRINRWNRRFEAENRDRRSA